jgi:F0F1-type ATP synthase membrane subunit c/vacuolar-type H+-ATPase subunit K
MNDQTSTNIKATVLAEAKIDQKITPGISEEVVLELSKEINNMLSFAVYNGITVNTDLNTLIQNSNVGDLINAHNILCKNIAPATPKSIVYTKKLNTESNGKSIFQKLPLLRNLILLAVLFLIAYVATGMSPLVNNDSLDKGIMSNNGLPLLLNIIYLGSVAGLGVLFYLLKEVTVSLKNSSLIPENAIAYLSQIILGIMAGIIMSEIISFYTTNPKQINLFNKSVLALVGGFSSDAIFSILQGIIAKIKNIFISPNTIK